MSAYLINGPSGSGKTSIGDELQRKGFHVINTDEKFGYYANLKTEEAVEFPVDEVTEEWYRDNGWIWNRKKMEYTLTRTDEDIFLCGGSLNESSFYPRFEKIFRLVVDADILVARIKSRGNDGHTNNPDFIARMLNFLETAKLDGEKAGMIIIDTSRKSISESTDELLSYLQK
ncbi:AAA family ATPase [Candidatus Saccharibacteria bacterium]|jgi:gluconate kinase|nr:AAA family ATPase [Candidatus Saccharibacteria bacterium]